MKKLVCCIVCKRELSTQGMPGHIRAVHDRGLAAAWPTKASVDLVSVAGGEQTQARARART